MNNIYLHAASSITDLSTFENSGFSEKLINGNLGAPTSKPDYKKYIATSLLRRTPLINKMAIACTVSCLEKSKEKIPDAIIVGTGLGCLTDSERFLSECLKTSKGNMLSPTAFIQSGHNSISGQIALLGKNHCYNITHVHKGISFENALLDAMLCIRENKKCVLVGAVDEITEMQPELARKFSISAEVINKLSGGSSFFIINGDAENAMISIKDVQITGPVVKTDLDIFIKENNLIWDEIDIVLTGYNLYDPESIDIPVKIFEYTSACGRYFSSSAFGFHLASDYLHSHKGAKNVIIINYADSKKTGLMLLSNE